MYLSKLTISGFRTYSNANPATVHLQKGLNLIVGPNNSGKTALIDAIKLVLGTKSDDWLRVTKEDFHFDGATHQKKFQITLEFDELTDEEEAFFLEWVGFRENQKPFLKIWLSANRIELSERKTKYESEISVNKRAGPDGIGTHIESEQLRALRATYLKPLRDAERELAAKKSSRLSQILHSHDEIKKSQDEIIEIIKTANTQLNNKIQTPISQLNDQILKKIIFSVDKLKATSLVSDPTLKDILETLRLSLIDTLAGNGSLITNQGLGYLNILFMATELLLLSSSDIEASIPILLVEEPEAHLHPQLQMNLVRSLAESKLIENQTFQIQSILSTHSPVLSSAVDPAQICLIDSKHNVFSLSKEHTLLEKDDYIFLRKFIDVTKSNLFFANAVVFVEGDSERILLPTLAQKLGYSFESLGVSIVSIGHVGFMRFANIFKRKVDPRITTKVACITDKDIVPKNITYVAEKKGRFFAAKLTDAEVSEMLNNRKEKIDGDSVKTFISDEWTLEYDLCASDLFPECHRVLCQSMKKTIAEWEESKHAKEENLDSRIKAELETLQKMSKEDRASKMFQIIFEKSVSKTDFSYNLSKHLLDEHTDAPETFKSKIPDYLKKAIEYVISSEN